MADARLAHDWGQTAEVLAMIHNVNVSDAAHRIKSTDINPTYRKPVSPPDSDEFLDRLGRVWVDGEAIDG